MSSSALEAFWHEADACQFAPSGFPLLHEAVINDDPRAVAYLLKRRASLSQKGPLGFTALELAQSLGRRACLHHLNPLSPRYIKVGRRDMPELEHLTVPEFEAWTGVRYAPFIEADLKLLRFAVQCCRRGEHKGYFDTERRWLGQWHAPDMARGDASVGVVKWIDSSLGYGLFSDRDLPAYSFVGAYTGRLIRRDLLLLRTNEYCFRYPTGVETIRPLLIDAEAIGNELRYANHSDRPNMDGIGVPYGPIVQVIFRTNRVVHHGEQLTYDYGPDFWKHRDTPKLPI